MESVAVIDLNKLKQNAKSIKSALPDGVKFIAVVKANAYGHGAVEVSNAIYPFVDGYAVALLKEAIELRQAGIDKDITLLIPASATLLERGLKYDITFTVENLSIAKTLNSLAKKRGVFAKVEIAVNTGMNRFGFSPEDLTAILPELKKLKNLSVNGIFSHLFQPENPIARFKQVKVFKKIEKEFKEYFPFAIAHISATGGYLKGEFFDGVRIGLGLYGYLPFKTRVLRAKVEPILKVYSPIVKNGTVKVSDNLLYGDFKMSEDCDYSILRYGYADGLPRKPVENQLNNRCMDVTAIKKSSKNENFCILFENADDFAKKYGTISYEILTCVANRAKRVYLR